MEQEEQGLKEVYLYAIVPEGIERGTGLRGLFDREVVVLPAGRVAAVVSAVPEGGTRIRPERKNLAAHQSVLAAFTRNGRGILPVAFGTVSPDGEAVRRLIREHEDELLHQMERVAGAVELELRVEVKLANAFEYFVRKVPELREARDRFFGKPQGASRDEKIALGQFFERTLEAEREKIAAALEEGVSGAAVELKRNDCRNERELARLSCLVPRDRQGAFEERLDRAARDLPDEFSVIVSGPFPAYHFVDFRLSG